MAGLLAALGAGYLALELARVLAFVGGGAVAGLLVKTFLPTLHEPLLAFLAGGLLAVLLFRLMDAGPDQRHRHDDHDVHGAGPPGPLDAPGFCQPS